MPERQPFRPLVDGSGTAQTGRVSPPASGSVLVYDGDCGFCSATARFLRRWVDRRERYAIEPWQALDLVSLGLTEAQCTDAAQFVAPGSPPRAGHRAIAAALREGEPPWRIAGRIITLGPIDRLSALVYRWVASHRQALPGGTTTCDVGPSHH